MANVLHPDVLDLGLNVLDTLADAIHIVSADPTDYADTIAKSLGNKVFVAGSAFGAPVTALPNGRAVASAQITDGDVTGNGTAAGWAVVDSVDGKLLANGALLAPQVVVQGNTFQLPSFSIRMPDR